MTTLFVRENSSLLRRFKSGAALEEIAQVHERTVRAIQLRLEHMGVLEPASVLIRAPGWPLGPGDPDAGVVAARRAVILQPLYPPNLPALPAAFPHTGASNSPRNLSTPSPHPP